MAHSDVAAPSSGRALGDAKMPNEGKVRRCRKAKTKTIQIEQKRSLQLIDLLYKFLTKAAIAFVVILASLPHRTAEYTFVSAHSSLIESSSNSVPL